MKDIEITGLQEALKYIKNRQIDITKNVEKAISDSTIFLEGEVKNSIAGQRSEPRSVDTGEFLSSVQSESSGFDGVVSSDVPQSLFMEFGTTRIPERRHFRNSGARSESAIFDKINNAVIEGAS